MNKILIMLGLVAGVVSTNLEACTGMELIAKDGSLVHGRTLEFGIKIDTSIVVVPRGYEFTGTTPAGKGLTYKSKYGVTGAIAFGHPAIMDGLNEKGLAVGAFYFSGYAGYSTIDSNNQSKAVSPVEFPNWILTQFATVDEVKAGLSNVVIAPTVVSGWGPTPPPLHYIVYDKSGNILVIEPMDGKLVTQDNPIGVFTNSPTFDWHMTNIRNFINLTPFNVKPLKIRNIELTSFGQGSGLVGLPGDFTPPSRFVRATLYTATAPVPANSEDGVFQLLHILNQFDIPVGATKSEEGGVVYSDYTQVTVARDPQTLNFYYRTYDDQTIRFVDLNKFDLAAKDIMALSTSGYQRAVDSSAELKPFK